MVTFVYNSLSKKTGLELFDGSLAYLDEIWNQVISEIESMKTGQRVDNPLCHIMADMENEEVIDLGVARMLLRQAECFTVVAE